MPATPGFLSWLRQARAKSLFADPAVDLRFRVFVWLLAASVPIHTMMWLRGALLSRHPLWGIGARLAWTPGFWAPEPLQLFLDTGALCVAAVPLLLGIGRRRAILLLLAGAVARALFQPHHIENHYVLFLFCVTVCAFFPLPAPGRPGRRDATMMTLRTLCVMAYWFAFLHKLNTTYTSIDGSTTRTFVLGVLKNVSIDAEAAWPSFGKVFIYASLLFELLIPVGLSFRKTRRVACLAGLLFHGFICLTGHGEFSQMILSFYVLFLDEDELRALLAELGNRARWPRAVLALGIGSVLAWTSYVHAPVAGPSASTVTVAVTVAEGVLLGLLLAMIALLFLILADPRSSLGAPVERETPKPLPPALLAAMGGVLGLYAVNCLGPYIGLKETYSQAMFSDLGRGGKNHLFMPSGNWFDLDVYVRHVVITPAEPWSKDDGAADSLRVVQGFTGLIHRNYLNAILSHACVDPGHAPIAVSYELESGEKYRSADVCETHLGYYSFELYLPFRNNRGEAVDPR